jgi:hypothetical protein
MDSFMSRELISRPKNVPHSYTEDIDILQRFHKWSIAEAPNKASQVLNQLHLTIIPILDKIVREIGGEDAIELFVIRTLMSNLKEKEVHV